jgi:Tfp pilus assembly protein FimT
MSTLDEITNEKQRVTEALARVDAQREKLTGQLEELEATERVLARYSKGAQTRNTASAKTPTAATKSAVSGRSRPATARAAGSKRSSSSLSDQVLAPAIGKTQQEITTACKGARPNHVGAAIARHKRAGRIEERNGKLYATQSAGAGQHAAV